MRASVAFLITLLVIGAFALGLLVGQKQQYNSDSRQFARDQQAVTDSYNRGRTDQARSDCEQIRAYAPGRGITTSPCT